MFSNGYRQMLFMKLKQSFSDTSAYSGVFSSFSPVRVSSISFGGGVVAIVQPIHAPTDIIAMNTMKN
jgi:hypothetical protein